MLSLASIREMKEVFNCTGVCTVQKPLGSLSGVLRLLLQVLQKYYDAVHLSGNIFNKVIISNFKTKSMSADLRIIQKRSQFPYVVAEMPIKAKQE
jgi:hypothetical protein